jgi:hypothetical protein
MEKRKKRNHKAKQQKKLAQTIRTASREIPLTETDRITYVYARDKTEDAIREIINVSYDAWIEKSWLTILRYDSTHGYLHQHTRFSLTQEKEFISKEHIPQEGSHQEWAHLGNRGYQNEFFGLQTGIFQPERSLRDRRVRY